MNEYFKDYGAHIIAFVALVQVWIIAFWKRYMQRGRIEVHPTATIEVGFGNFGPSIALMGTLRANAKDVFVDKMSVRVTRLKDRAQHEFFWKVFRSNSITLSTNLPQSVEIASSFLLTPERPRQYNVFFAFPSFSTEYAPIVQPLRDAWNQYLRNKLDELEANHRIDVSTILQDANLSGTFFQEFVTKKEPGQVFTQISNDFFWRASDYEIQLTVHCTDPSPDLVRNWAFSLTEKDEEVLRINVVTLLRELCYLPATHNLIYKDYVTI